ncbi:STAS domain-containing protein [Blastopirellula sp. JC732]|uniref:STAS domain-containing protein n=1 Tax=Blastopirellula sediminis TaxID=2894196 RepID=A0A9X1MPL9_9BACT|nr:STAS domain-containing protein [Blastopirellula sediminis]MCC9630045.1 STAS domain-containing protein [Blastopirellula sediminis]
MLSSREGDLVKVTLLPEELRTPEDCYDLRNEMIAAADGCRVVLINFENVTFMSSVGLLSFLGLRRAVAERDVRIIFFNLCDNLNAMLTLCRLISDSPHAKAPFETAESEAAAVALAT